MRQAERSGAAILLQAIELLSATRWQEKSLQSLSGKILLKKN